MTSTLPYCDVAQTDSRLVRVRSNRGFIIHDAIYTLLLFVHSNYTFLNSLVHRGDYLQFVLNRVSFRGKAKLFHLLHSPVGSPAQSDYIRRNASLGVCSVRVMRVFAVRIRGFGVGIKPWLICGECRRWSRKRTPAPSCGPLQSGLHEGSRRADATGWRAPTPDALLR